MAEQDTEAAPRECWGANQPDRELIVALQIRLDRFAVFDDQRLEARYSPSCFSTSGLIVPSGLNGFGIPRCSK